MRIDVDSDITRLVARAADLIEALVRTRPDAVLGIATGSTPEPLYAELAARAAAGLDFSRLRIASLDEYVGLGADHPQSYRHFVQRHVIEPLGIDPGNIVVPDGAAEPQQAAADFDRGLQRLGGVDLQILGIGPNGHIAFNEPGSALESGVRVVSLSDSTVEANARFFPSAADVPTKAITQGVGTILRSRRAVLLAFGSAKAEATAAMIDGPVTAAVPASALQRHPAAEVFLDEAAAAQLCSVPSTSLSASVADGCV
ncbi:glucosamine-6-phosphate deaminase [Brevibacterium daeguense]|uniref:Glucosamine-6-phosphate deaminase n=1 Tax=Brevibacterium daeguense TaxID=909936 RepID=A0ABP8EJZ9_9MICO|nr:glucosamine-6-phosphate deaminase [Brevibacterium daeguense]